MSNTVIEAVHREALKLIKRHQRYANELAENAARKQRRSGVATNKTVLLPSYWSIDRGFDPYYVRANRSRIGHAVESRLKDVSYAPRPAIAYEVPKPDGGIRRTGVFQVADNAISRLLYKNLLVKNASRFSSRCYAYRTDLTLQDAIAYIHAEFSDHTRLFVAEFDFSKYFDMISHEHLERLLSDGRFCVTDRERRMLAKFMRVPALDEADYSRGSMQERERGIPQGTSLSLFLANIAAFPLDTKLERLGVGFARFADDTLIWSSNYAEVCEAVEVLNTTSYDMGVDLNFKKSPGISILTGPNEPAEFQRKSSVSFLGHQISKETVGIRPSTVDKMKKEVSFIIYSNLLQSLIRGHVVPERFAPYVDRDYVAMLYQIRRYLYGDLSENKLRRYLNKDVPRIRFRGYMSTFPLVDDEEQLVELDGWLLNSIWRALRKRTRLLKGAGHHHLPQPHGHSREQLLNLFATAAAGTPLDLRVPSFRRFASMLRKAAGKYGPSAIARQPSHSEHIS